MGSFHFKHWAHDQRVMALFLCVIISTQVLQTDFFLLRLVGAATILHQLGKWGAPQDLPAMHVCGDSAGM